MLGGEGVDSYTRNSTMQALGFSLIAPALKSVIAARNFGYNATSLQPVIRIADLGCATGYNTISAVRVVAEAVRAAAAPELEFQAFFLDLSSNDFNTLFRQLEQLSPPLRCFTAAVSGSFYERLFPSSSLHIAMCNMSLHWLSKIPERKSDDPCAGHFTLRYGAFATQAHEDLCRFLSCRAQEIVPRGILSLIILMDESCQPEITSFEDWHVLKFEQAWNDMLEEELIDDETHASFRMPWFYRTIDEVVKANAETGEAFEILKLEQVKCLVASNDPTPASLQSYATAEVSFCKNITHGSISRHLKNNSDLVNEFYKRLHTKFVLKTSSEVPAHVNFQLAFAILQRK